MVQSIAYSSLMIRIQRSQAITAEHQRHQSWLLANGFREPTSHREIRLPPKLNSLAPPVGAPQGSLRCRELVRRRW